MHEYQPCNYCIQVMHVIYHNNVKYCVKKITHAIGTKTKILVIIKTCYNLYIKIIIIIEKISLFITFFMLLSLNCTSHRFIYMQNYDFKKLIFFEKTISQSHTINNWGRIKKMVPLMSDSRTI